MDITFLQKCRFRDLRLLEIVVSGYSDFSGLSWNMSIFIKKN